ncbi:hypothetical protein GCM10010219_40660 [Streptomyces netropsis]|nr:hypothetical protein GCM10010219_40660 [Streptomyces netropsis]
MRAGQPPISRAPRYVAVHRDADGVPDGYASYSIGDLLTVRDGKADCVPTDREPDLSLHVRDLGSVYLGGTAPSTLVRAGHVRAHRPGAAALADALFRAERSPHCLHWF